MVVVWTQGREGAVLEVVATDLASLEAFLQHANKHASKPQDKAVLQVRRYPPSTPSHPGRHR